MARMRAIDLIVIHCAATPNGRRFTAADIDAWHYARGFRRQLAFRQRQEMNLAAIGYHYVLYVNGAVAAGRHLDEIGAHAKGHNTRSIGVCLIGTDRFTLDQWTSLEQNICATIATLARRRAPAHAPKRRPAPAQALRLARELGVRVVGHRDLSPDRDGDGTVMHLKAARDAGRLTPAAKVLGYPWLVAGVLIDAAFNLVTGTLLFLELPRELLFTSRVSRLNDHAGWRGNLARWFCRELLDPFDPAGRHCR